MVERTSCLVWKRSRSVHSLVEGAKKASSLNSFLTVRWVLCLVLPFMGRVHFFKFPFMEKGNDHPGKGMGHKNRCISEWLIQPFLLGGMCYRSRQSPCCCFC